MNRHRYESVPQRSTSTTHRAYDPQIASPIPLSTAPSSYNFNTGLPSSASSLIDTPSTTNTPIPNSPPPSFHTHSSPGTPRPTQSIRSASLWGVAPSTVTTGDTTSNDALATIAGLKQRVEWLEESIGRLLLEKEERSSSAADNTPSIARDNCCVSFTDATPDLERAIMRGRNNCCVSFQREEGKREKDKRVIALSVGVFMVFFMLMFVFLSGGRGGGGGGYGVRGGEGGKGGYGINGVEEGMKEGLS
ncbi:hypothetical protein GLAREA_01319 [Glarea lozoyensis ATCC 20868]|uniref:Uncharacterized protein n=1 Tax=Glarea lozoyensis (strain ATCC 20868 / MF5171) TaxID=1116229 RepID=S3CFW7_GLAL2|nr:uncharacterized protein GLAREA_01319 [Glarea lozoyensis ATCC 20868]EPE25407.1 hypothetical protein GLAREA_01319 [Glarea lozoyensis ATCC 20868]